MTKLPFILLLAIYIHAQQTAKNASGPIWERTFRTWNRTGSNQTSVPPEMNRSSGISGWDSSHVLVYSLEPTGQLASRMPNTASKGAWSFHLGVLETSTGKTDQEATIPASSFTSELQLVSGGIVESDPGCLVFYSRTFRELKTQFKYSPMAGHWVSGVPRSAGIIAGRIYAAPNGQHLALFDSDGHQAKLYLFDGLTFTNTFQGSIDNIDLDSVSIGNKGFFYTDMDQHSRVHFVRFDRPEDDTVEFASRDNSAHEPIYLSPDSWIDVFHQVTLVDSGGRAVLFHERRMEGILGPAVISSDKRWIAVVKDDVRNAGPFDRDYRRVGVGALVIGLSSPTDACEISIKPIPIGELALEFAENSSLIVLHDGVVSAYKVPCA